VPTFGGNPRVIFERIVPFEIVTSCGTYESEPGHFFETSEGFISEILIFPELGSKTPKIKSIKVVFPAPEGPTTATTEPGAMLRHAFVIA
jgi:hypothetical protein